MDEPGFILPLPYGIGRPQRRCLCHQIDAMIHSVELPDATVAIAVCSGGRSRRAVRWAATKLIPYAHRVLLLHVFPFVSSIPSPSGGRAPVQKLDKRWVELYTEDVRAKVEEVIFPFRRFCRSKHVNFGDLSLVLTSIFLSYTVIFALIFVGMKVETLVMYGTNTADALLKYISDSGIKNLVLGSSSMGWVRSPFAAAGPKLQAAKDARTASSPLLARSRGRRPMRSRRKVATRMNIVLVKPTVPSRALFLVIPAFSKTWGL